MERVFILSTNVKKWVLIIMLLLDIIALKYANINISKLYVDSKNKALVLLSDSKNIQNKNELHKAISSKDNNLNSQSNLNKDANQVKQSSEAPKVSEKNNQQANNNENVNNQLSRGNSLGYETDIVLTFYTSLEEENGGYKGINCLGKKLTPGMVANNVLPLGTEIYTNEFGTLTVYDRGGNNFDTIHRLDVYIPRNDGENDREYLKRVNNMGKVKVKGYIVKQ